MKTLCPICSGTLLRHLYPNKVLWFCLRCRQEMPNFNLFSLSSIQEQLVQYNDNFNDNRIVYLNSQNKANLSLIEHKPNVVDLSAKRDQKRLEVVSFILKQINIILINAFTKVEQSIVSSQYNLKQLDAQHIKLETLTKAEFLRDSEAILLCICQAILLADSTILNNFIVQNSRANSVNFRHPVEQSCFIDLIKTLVIDFVYSITLDSPKSIDRFALEIAGYFEIAIGLIIKRKINPTKFS